MKGFLIAITILCVIIIAQMESLNSMVRGAYVIKNADILVKMSKDTPWDNLPVFLKEQIAKKSMPTKFNEKDLEQVIKYYQTMLDNYTGPVSIGEKADEQVK